MEQNPIIAPKDTLLVVDDQPNNLKVIASILGDDYNLSIANNGLNALKNIDYINPQLILLDIMMPEMDGFEVCQKLKQSDKYKNIPIIFITAKTDIADIEKGFNLGAADYITKPFNPTEIKVRVRNHLNLYHSLNDLNKANSNLEKLNWEKDRFFSIISHDLKGFFNSFLGLTELLVTKATRSENTDIMRYASALNEAATNGYSLLENLLHWSRVKTNHIDFNPKPTSLNDAIFNVISLNQIVINKKNITYSINIEPDLEVVADFFMLETILRNLVSNALKYTKSGGKLSVDAKRVSNHIQISITDNGIGIHPENIPKLFRIDTPFSTHGTNNEIGTGLGLILCKEFVEKHNGNIWVESEIGKGSTFTFTIPFPE